MIPRMSHNLVHTHWMIAYELTSALCTPSRPPKWAQAEFGKEDTNYGKVNTISNLIKHFTKQEAIALVSKHYSMTKRNQMWKSKSENKKNNQIFVCVYDWMQKRTNTNQSNTTKEFKNTKKKHRTKKKERTTTTMKKMDVFLYL